MYLLKIQTAFIVECSNLQEHLHCISDLRETDSEWFPFNIQAIFLASENAGVNQRFIPCTPWTEVMSLCEFYEVPLEQTEQISNRSRTDYAPKMPSSDCLV